MSGIVVCPECEVPINRVTGRVDPRGGHLFTSVCGHLLPADVARAAHDAGRPVWQEPVTGAALISAERARQHTEEGYDDKHDAEHAVELSWGAWSLLDHVASGGLPDAPPPKMWPWQAVDWKPEATAVRMLVKAGALIAAEIDRRLARGERP